MKWASATFPVMWANQAIEEFLNNLPGEVLAVTTETFDDGPSDVKCLMVRVTAGYRPKPLTEEQA